MNQTRINNSLFHLLDYIEKEKYMGLDPYDALKSPLFKFNYFRKNKILRFTTQQFVKRIPINIRPLLRIVKGYNPVTLGLCLQAYGYLSMVFPERKEEYYNKSNLLISELERLIPDGFSGACWGYDFDWEARNASIPAYQPNIVATGIITNALFENFLLTRNQKTIELCLSSTNFVLKDLKRTYENELFCYSYSPFDSQKVFNASMKAVRLLAQVYSVTKDEQLLANARKAVSYVVKKQNNDGSWVYANNEKRIDNYHTGYVLDCLNAYNNYTGDKEYINNLEKGFIFYKENFIEKDGFPKFLHNYKYPLDCTAGAQSILTLTRFGEIELAIKVANYINKNMQDREGYFYFRKYKHYIIKTPYMRWSQAWMFAALTYLALSERF